MQSEAALQRVGHDAGKGRQQSTAQEYAARCGGEEARTRGGRKQTVPQPAKAGTEWKRGNRRLLRDGACYSRAQRHQPRRCLLYRESANSSCKKTGSDFGRRTARAEIVFDRQYDAAAKFGIPTGQTIELGAEAFGRPAIGEDCFRDRIPVRGSVSATARDLEQLGRYQPLDLAGDIGFDQQPATTQAASRGFPARRAVQLASFTESAGPARNRLAGARKRSQPMARRCSARLPSRVKWRSTNGSIRSRRVAMYLRTASCTIAQASSCCAKSVIFQSRRPPSGMACVVATATHFSPTVDLPSWHTVPSEHQ